MAQDISKEVKVEKKFADVELNAAIKAEIKKDRKMARLYKFKNSRVKKELSFTTKRNNSKLA